MPVDTQIEQIEKASEPMMVHSEDQIDEKLAAGQATAPRPLGAQLLAIFAVIALLYVFLTSIGLLGAGFKIFGKGFAKALIETTANPFVGLFIGILATSLIQSSSTTTSMVVAFVASGALTIEHAVPMVMGANIGTTVTNTLVSLGHISRRAEFKRALSAATVHDFFNLMAVAVLLPLELATGFLRQSATWLASLLFGSSTLTFSSPVKVVTKPLIGVVTGGVEGLPKGVAGTLVALLGIALLLGSLYLLTKLMRSMLIERIEAFFNKTIGSSGLLGILMGLVITTIVQSSSITTSLMIPMAAAGAVSLAQVFPITLGANLGTTVTALMAALAGNVAGLTIAIVHFFFNLCGTLLIYPIPAIRRIPIRLAEGLGALASRSRLYAVGFVLGVFFVTPGVLILIYRLVS